MPFADRHRFAQVQAGLPANQCRPAKSPIEGGGVAPGTWPILVTRTSYLHAKAAMLQPHCERDRLIQVSNCANLEVFGTAAIAQKQRIRTCV